MTNQNNATKVITGVVRLSYAHIFTPQPSPDGGEPKYSTSILVPKSDKATIKKIEKAIEAAIELGKSKWGGKIPKNLKLPLRDGDEEREDDEAYAGHYFFNASSKQKPGIIDRYGNEIIDSTEVYSGCYVKVSVNFYPFDKNGNRGIAAGLNNILFWEHGEPLGGRARPEDDFANDLINDEEDDDLLG